LGTILTAALTDAEVAVDALPEDSVSVLDRRADKGASDGGVIATCVIWLR
jgi:hypothetical protein